jgi:hypothetical protein
MNQNNQAIAQLLAMTQPQQQQPLLAPPVKSSMPSTAPIADPMQGMAQMAQSAAGAYRDRNMAGHNPAFPTAPMNGGGVFGLLSNPMAKYSMGGGLY